MADFPYADPRYIADRIAIMDVMVKYGTAVDAREMDRYRSCFTDDLTVVGYGGDDMEGADTYLEYVIEALKNFPGHAAPDGQPGPRDRRRHRPRQYRGAGDPLPEGRPGRDHDPLGHLRGRHGPRRRRPVAHQAPPTRAPRLAAHRQPSRNAGGALQVRDLRQHLGSRASPAHGSRPGEPDEHDLVDARLREPPELVHDLVGRSHDPRPSRGAPRCSPPGTWAGAAPCAASAATLPPPAPH